MNASRSLAAFLLLLAFALAPFAQGSASAVLAQSAPGSISGRVLDGSANAQPVPGAAVTLSLFDGPNKRQVTAVQSDAAGSYRFGNLQTGAGLVYVASVGYAGVSYTSQPVVLETSQDRQADVTLYEATTDAASVSIQRLSIVLAGVDQRNGQITVVESYHLRNDATAAYVGDASSGQQQTLQLPLFQGARSLSPLDGFRIDDAIATSRGFALSSPVLPGDTVLSFTYEVPFQQRSLVLRRVLAYRTELVELVLSGSVQVSSPQLAARRQIQLGERRFDTIQATNLPSGAPLVLDLSGLPAQPAPFVNLESLPVQVTLMGIILAAIASTVVYLRRQRGTASAP